jgi:PAS domain S-box-containing protein
MSGAFVEVVMSSPASSPRKTNEASAANSAAITFGGWLPRDLESPTTSAGLADALFEGNPDIVLVVDAEGRIAGANSRALKEYGYERRQLEGEPLEMLLPISARDRHTGHMQRYMKNPTVRAMGSCMNLQSRDALGNEFPVDVMLWPLDTGYSSYVIAVCHRLDAALARVHTQIHALIDNHRDHAVNLLDAEGLITTWNAGSERIYNLTASEVLGKNFAILFTPVQIAAGEPETHLEEARQNGESSRTTGWRNGEEDAFIWAETHVSCTRDSAGQVIGFTLMLRDLTTYRRGEEKLLEANRALAESEQRFRLMIKSVTDYAIYMLDPQGNIITWNEGAERNKGYTQEEALGRNFSMFFTPEALEAGLPAQELASAAEHGRYETENWRLRKGGERFWAMVTLTAIHGPDGELQGFAKVTRDMTMTKLVEDSQAQLAAEMEKRVAERTSQLASTVEELKTKNEEIEALVAMVTHDLSEKEVLLREVYHRVKNNLQVVQSLLKMGARTLPSLDARQAIETAVQRVHVMAMVHEHLYQTPDLAGLTLSSYLRDVVEGAIASNSEQPERIQLHFETDEIPIPLDYAIPLGLLANELVSNCLKHGLAHGRAGKISITARNIPGAMRLAVHDNGVGLPEGFDASKTTSMGLKLASSLAHQLGGKLSFSSASGCRIEADLTRLSLPRERAQPEPSSMAIPVRALALQQKKKGDSSKSLTREFCDPSSYLT